jgi:hypothetical protein
MTSGDAMRIALGVLLVSAVVLVAVLLAWADARFQADGDAAEEALLASVSPLPTPVVTPEDLAALPAPVRRWLDAAGVIGKPRARVVRLRQRGLMRTAPDQTPMPTDAHQLFTVEPPGFVWRARVTMKRVVPIAGRDEYRDGRGHMRIAVASLVPVVDAAGAEIDQGTLLRYLGEMVWFPSAALAPYLRWEAVDDTSARATMTFAGVSATATFAFDAEGRFLRLTAQRYMDGPDGAVLRDWVVTASHWGEMDGVRVPVQGAVTWRLPAGDFEYYRWQITAIEYDGVRTRTRAAR